MDYKNTFSYCLLSEIPESKHQFHYKYDYEPTYYDFEQWILGKLYCITLIEEIEGKIQAIDYDFPIEKEKHIHDFLDFHFSKYKSSLENFKLSLKCCIKLSESNHDIRKNIPLYDGINGFIFEWMDNKVDDVMTIDSNIQSDTHKTIKLQDNVITWLQETISKNGNGKPFIENCNGKLKWLQNKQNARVLLAHEKIRGNLSKNEAIKQAPIIFIYNDNKPLTLGKNDTRQENTNTIDLRNFLNELKNTTT